MMAETKKCMPTITHYLSDNDNEDTLENSVVIPQVHTNYAEWKRLKKNSSHLQNGRRNINRPLADISSSEEDYNFDDNEPIFKIMNYLVDKHALPKHNENYERKSKKPSQFLLFCRMKQRIHFNCSFSDLCHMVHASWENMDANENEELISDIGWRTREYNEALINFRKSCLPDFKSITKLPPTVSTKVIPSDDPSPYPLTLPSQNSFLSPTTDCEISQRLHSFTSEASVHHVTEKCNKISYQDFISSKRQNMHESEPSPENEVTCNFPDCENKPIEDYRWHGQYCSAKCLINDCHGSFADWLKSRTPILSNENEQKNGYDSLEIEATVLSNEIENSDNSDQSQESSSDSESGNDSEAAIDENEKSDDLDDLMNDTDVLTNGIETKNDSDMITNQIQVTVNGNMSLDDFDWLNNQSSMLTNEDENNDDSDWLTNRTEILSDEHVNKYYPDEVTNPTAVLINAKNSDTDCDCVPDQGQILINDKGMTNVDGSDWLILQNNEKDTESSEEEDEIILCLESPSHEADDSYDSSNGIFAGRQTSKMSRSFFRYKSSPSKRHYLIKTPSSDIDSSSPVNDVDSFCDNQERDFVT